MKKKNKQRNKQRKLTLWLHEKSKMASLKEGRFQLHFGNYWDFHAGCYGTKMLFADGSEIDFEAVWHEGIRRPWSVAEMVAKRIGATVETKFRKTPFEC
jgi:hypothetical protein